MAPTEFVAAQRRRSGIVSRADLLEALQRESFDWFVLPTMGDAYGFQRMRDEPAPVSRWPVSPGENARISASDTPPVLHMPECWAVTDIVRDDGTEANDATEPEPAMRISPAPRPTLEASEQAARHWLNTGAQQAWPQLHTALRRLLCPNRVRRRSPVDWAAATRRIARGKALFPLPHRQRPRWPANLVLVLDRLSDSMTPLVDDMDALALRLQRAIGARAVDLRVLHSASAHANGAWSRPDQPQATQAWQPLFGEQMLLVSDLAVAQRSAHRRVAFQAWLQRMAHGGTEILVMSHGDLPPASLPTQARQVGWFADSGRRDDGVAESPELADLLALVAMAGCVSDALLRALAHIVRPGPPPLPLIWAAWNHPAICSEGRMCWLDEAGGARYGARLPSMPLPLLQQAAEQRRLLQAPLPDGDEHLAALRMLGLAPQTTRLAGAEHAQAAALAYLDGELPQEVRSAASERAQAVMRAERLMELAGPNVRRSHRATFQRLQRLVAAEALRRGEPVKTYAELGPVTIEPTQDTHPVRHWTLLRQSDRLRLAPVDAGEPGIVLAADLHAPASAGVHLHTARATRWIATTDEALPLADLAAEPSPLDVRIGRNRLRLERFERPTWASGWCHTSAGLRVRFATPWSSEAELPWPCPPRHRAESSHQGAGFAFGVDDYGLFLDLTLRKVTQRLRWIEPGEFLMGSPENEPERDTDEGPQHRVHLSEGFWLADSACTQALWLAVMAGRNPSRFDDDLQCPVERVSWDEVQEFMQRLREHLPASSEPILPSEAQWEYACRAGTTTPFNLGENITPEQVNYNGYFPYNGANRGLHRNRTVPVKSLPPNAWGLYEMHGNVWEWCADGMREYASLPAGEVLRDPLGPTESASASRALRGGSWFVDAGIARSARRSAGSRDLRRDDFGFRLALRSASPERPEGA